MSVFLISKAYILMVIKMRAFIYDKYGYYVEEENAISFKIDDWNFELVQIDKKEFELENLDNYLKQISGLFNNAGANIILNRDGQYLSTTDFGTVALVAIKERMFTIDELSKLHVHFQNIHTDERYDLKNLIELWEDKVDLIEEKIIPSIKIDDYAYSTAMEITIHALGLAENAIQYLSELSMDESNQIPRLTLVHKRLKSLEAKDFLNPFNLVIDSPMRDYAELYKNGLVNIDTLLKILDVYSTNTFEASLLFARILFPTNIFDCLEDHYGERKDVRVSIINFRRTLDEEIMRIKKVHKALVSTYNIRPITWLLE